MKVVYNGTFRIEGHSFIGTMGRAEAISGLLKSEVESGRVTVDYGSWMTPIIVYGLTDEEAETLEELLTEA